MSFQLKRIMAGFLAALTLFSATACASAGTNDPENGTQQTATGEQESEFFPEIEKKDYDGATFQMITPFTKAGDWYYAEEYQNTQNKTAILNNTLYEMTTLIEEHLNVKLALKTITFKTGNELFAEVFPTIMAGDDAYQFCAMDAYYDNVNFITKNCALDLNELEAIDMSQFYWNQQVTDMLTIKGKSYLALSDACKKLLYVIYCNKDMLEDANRKMPYDAVRNGEWTLDMLAALSTELYQDNGDGLRNGEDIYGFSSSWDCNGAAFMQASNIFVATKTADDGFELCMYSDRLVEMYDKLYTWSRDESVNLWNVHNPSITSDFKKEQTYMMTAGLGADYLDVTFSVGILPLPKYDVQQESYCHVNWGNNMLVPNSVRNKDMVGEVIELLSFYSGTMVMQKYYDEILQLRVSDAPDDRDMVELIYDTVVYDPGIAFCDGNGSLWDLVYTTCFCIRNNNPNIASYYQAKYRSANKWLDTMVKKLK